MTQTVAFVTSLASLGLIGAIYCCSVLTRPTSWLRGETLSMILLALLTGTFPLAVGALLVGSWRALTGRAPSLAQLATLETLASVAAVAATILVFRALVKATRRMDAGPTDVTPPAPRPAPTESSLVQMRKAA